MADIIKFLVTGIFIVLCLFSVILAQGDITTQQNFTGTVTVQSDNSTDLNGTVTSISDVATIPGVQEQNPNETNYVSRRFEEIMKKINEMPSNVTLITTDNSTGNGDINLRRTNVGDSNTNGQISGQMLNDTGIPIDNKTMIANIKNVFSNNITVELNNGTELLNNTDNLTNNEGPERRIYYGRTETRKAIPYTSVVSLRTSKNPFTVVCSGVLISPRLVLTASHCIIEVCVYYIGYGYFEVKKQHLVKVAHAHHLPEMDVAHLQLISDILLPVSLTFTYFNRLTWTLDNVDNYLRNTTYLCGYGAWEGKNLEGPVQTDVLRCIEFAFSVNMKVCFDNQFPHSINDQKYLCSMNIDQVWFYDAKYKTSCFFDGGAPVFFYNGDQDIELLAIHHGGPRACGTGPYMEAATLMKYIEPYLTS